MLIFMICATRTNIVYTLIFLTLLVVFLLLSSAYWLLGEENVAAGNKCVKVSVYFSIRSILHEIKTNSEFCFQGAGASLFVASLLGFYLLIVQLFEEMGFPFHLPVGDLGAFWDRSLQK